MAAAASCIFLVGVVDHVTLTRDGRSTVILGAACRKCKEVVQNYPGDDFPFGKTPQREHFIRRLSSFLEDGHDCSSLQSPNITSSFQMWPIRLWEIEADVTHLTSQDCSIIDKSMSHVVLPMQFSGSWQFSANLNGQYGGGTKQLHETASEPKVTPMPTEQYFIAMKVINNANLCPRC